MIICEPDGIWCSKCKTLHPTLFWHEKYNDYELNRKENFEENKRKRPQLFKDASYIDYLPQKNLFENKEMGKCIICGELTYFQHTLTNNFVCSDECKYKDKEELK